MINLHSSNSNQFFALRHGQSLANVKGIICSNPSIATSPDYGLSEAGQQQATLAGQDVIQSVLNDGNIKGLCIISSDFSRAFETAQAVCHEYQVAANQGLPPIYKNKVITDIRLRERWFGDYDMQNDSNYQLVWEEDVKDSSQTLHDVESVDSVRNRAASVVQEYDALLHDHVIVLVAHGDVLQILQTAFLRIDGRSHRSLDHLETAKLRRLR
jgi:glucosyl-3-phosphoglycerate phosphatase